MIVCAVPVKDLVNAKQRLIKALAPDERMALARAMLRDVLHALGDAKLLRLWKADGTAAAPIDSGVSLFAAKMLP